MSVHPHAAPPRPREDWGLFGPQSPTWRVWSSPTALLAFQRSIVVETFDPFLAIAVEEQNNVRNDARGRFDRTIRYFLTVACGDSRAAIEASELLMRVHAKATGTEPITQRPYSANDPVTQLWIHVTGWHSNLICYERFGPGKLSDVDERRYWADCVKAAELQTCKPADVPRSRDEVRQYFAAVRPRLCVSEHARKLIHYFLYTPREIAGPRMWASSHMMSTAVLTTIPAWMRELAGIDQPRVVDALAVPLMRVAVRAAAIPALGRAMMRGSAPSAMPVLEQVLTAEKPLRDEVPTVAEARARFGRVSV